MASRVCTGCGKKRGLEHFRVYSNARGRIGPRARCRDCERRDYKRKYDEDPDGWTNRHLKHKYGITLDEYRVMYDERDGRCDICGCTQHSTLRPRLAVDHDHETGDIRGLLCFNCNAGLGKFRDNPHLLRQALAYMEGGQQPSQ